MWSLFEQTDLFHQTRLNSPFLTVLLQIRHRQDSVFYPQNPQAKIDDFPNIKVVHLVSPCSLLLPSYSDNFPNNSRIFFHLDHCKYGFLLNEFSIEVHILILCVLFFCLTKYRGISFYRQILKIFLSNISRISEIWILISTLSLFPALICDFFINSQD